MEPTVELCFKEWAGNSKYETVSRNTRAIRQLESHVREVLCKTRVEKIRGKVNKTAPCVCLRWSWAIRCCMHELPSRQSSAILTIFHNFVLL